MLEFISESADLSLRAETRAPNKHNCHIAEIDLSLRTETRAPTNIIAI